jgi:hypothetical protein
MVLGVHRPEPADRRKPDLIGCRTALTAQQPLADLNLEPARLNRHPDGHYRCPERDYEARRVGRRWQIYASGTSERPGVLAADAPSLVLAARTIAELRAVKAARTATMVTLPSAFRSD